jgi:hypothetical protein
MTMNAINNKTKEDANTQCQQSGKDDAGSAGSYTCDIEQ